MDAADGTSENDAFEDGAVDEDSSEVEAMHNVCSPMEVQAEYSNSRSHASLVRNKGHRHSHINPDPGFLQSTTGLSLIPTGGLIVRTMDRDSKTVTVQCANTCTADNFLMAVYAAFKNNIHFQEAMHSFATRSRERDGNVLLQFCERMTEVSTSYAIKDARWKLLMHFDELWSRGAISYIGARRIYVNLEDSEQDIVVLLWGSMGSIVQHQTCSNEACRFASVVKSVPKLILPTGCECSDLQGYLTQVMTNAESVNHCMEKNCGGVRSIYNVQFKHGLPPVLVIFLGEGDEMVRKTSFPNFLHCPGQHPREQ